MRRWWYMFTYMDLGKECLSCLDSLREAVESHRMNQREVDVDEGASIWLCANDECGSCKSGIISISS